MPEAAEVEIVRRGLRSCIGLNITAVEIYDPKLPDIEEVVGSSVVDIKRRGKLLGIVLDEDDPFVLSCHLRMTGQLLLFSSLDAMQAASLKHLRAHIVFSSGVVLAFADVRRFGTLKLEEVDAFASNLGPDLLEASDYELQAAIVLCRRSSRNVKAVMLDQRLVSGAGNYLVDEALWHERIHPQQEADTLTASEWLALWHACRGVAANTLARGGVSMRDYVDTSGSAGSGQEELSAYGRVGQPCFRCGSILVKAVVAGRGTVWCPTCQLQK